MATPILRDLIQASVIGLDIGCVGNLPNLAFMYRAFNIAHPPPSLMC